MKKPLLIILSLFLITGCSKKANKDLIEKQMESIHEQVLLDEIKKFRIVLKSKDRAAICVQAGMVCAALLQAGKKKESFI